MGQSINLTVNDASIVSLSVDEAGNVPMSVGAAIYAVGYDDYEGATVFTPGASAQTVHTANTHVVEDIIINPIPSNYGLITWDGSTLTVS